MRALFAKVFTALSAGAAGVVLCSVILLGVRLYFDLGGYVRSLRMVGGALLVLVAFAAMALLSADNEAAE